MERIRSTMRIASLAVFACTVVARGQSPGAQPLALQLDPILRERLVGLATDHQLVPKDGTFLVLSNQRPNILVVPLVSRRDPDAALFMYYLPDSATFYFMRVARNREDPDKTEMRLWGPGSRDILITAQGLPDKGGNPTFRLDQFPATRLVEGNIAAATAAIVEVIRLPDAAHAVSDILRTSFRLSVQLDETLFEAAGRIQHRLLHDLHPPEFITVRRVLRILENAGYRNSAAR